MPPSSHPRLTRGAPSGDRARAPCALVLAGGRGSRLHALTDRCAKPAVPFAAGYRIIDFVLSNCVHSGLRHVGVLTQYKAQSLIRHLSQAWAGAWGAQGRLDVVPAQQQRGDGWYAGTADAVWQNAELVRESGADQVLVLGGDHVYRMDYRVLLDEHRRSGAQVSVACLEVPLSQAGQLGVMGVDGTGRVHTFDEKPARPVPLPGRPQSALASMGLYVFDTAVLLEALARDAADARSRHDFGRDVLPQLIDRHTVRAHRFERSHVGPPGAAPYWRDVGTLDAYWETHMDLLGETPRLPLHDEDWPVLRSPPRWPPALLRGGRQERGLAATAGGDGPPNGLHVACTQALDCLLGEGSEVGAATLQRSVLFPRARVGDGCRLQDTLLLPGASVGRGVTLRRVIVEEGCAIGDGFIAGVDALHDRQRGFHVTPGGVTLITAERLAASATTVAGASAGTATPACPPTAVAATAAPEAAAV